MNDLRTAAQQAIALICSARLCEVNSMSSRQEMLRLLIEATDLLRAALQQAEPVLQGPVAWRYWKQKWNCWEYSDTKLEFPAVPAGTKMEPLYLVSPEVKSERPPVGTVHNSVKGGVVWNRWPDEMEDGTHLYVNPPPCQTCEALARTVLMDQMGRA